MRPDPATCPHQWVPFGHGPTEFRCQRCGASVTAAERYYQFPRGERAPRKG